VNSCEMGENRKIYMPLELIHYKQGTFCGRHHLRFLAQVQDTRLKTQKKAKKNINKNTTNKPS